ncbi:unnamed protein product [Brassicogethes aeneus]|uniref:RNA helicase n=1 Tax=Brassicogethes aeneus TaxID=1431903 RepID=A0A9P0FKR7_BRAAE|nr:unnamed protein product [Brassicogethes aeneus]
MSADEVLDKNDFFLHEIPNVKISQEKPKVVRPHVKEELQFVKLTENVQENILDTLTYIHGPDFKLSEASAYEESKLNFGKKFWIGRGSLVVKGVVDYSQNKDKPTEEDDRLREFALLRLQSYGFHTPHCLEAFGYCNGNVEDALYLLYNKYMNTTPFEITDHNMSEAELLEQRIDEKSSLESIYEKQFSQKVDNVWVLTLKLDYLIKMFHKKEVKKPVNVKKKEMCKNFVRGNCKFGYKCRFSHEVEKVEQNPNSHLTEFQFDLEIRFPPNTKYPYEPPMIFIKTNAVLPPLVNLHISRRLYEEAKLLSQDGIPCVYTVTELLQNEEEIKEHLNSEVKFLLPNQKLFPTTAQENKIIRPSHYKKGRTNRSQKKQLTIEEILMEDAKIVKSFAQKTKDPKYERMMQNRKSLPAWSLKKEILNTIQKFQVVVVSGETGCGKSTQIPQFILDEWMQNYDNENNKHIEIVCTQPRRISAIGVAERVADERIEKIGNTVGYQIRLESKMSMSTRLSFCTTGILLRRLEGEPTLQNVTHIIVDEVHERSEESDFLLLILKELLQVRPDLKVILMSATLNADLFSNYFGDIPVIDIPGRTFPVEQYFLEDILEATDYVLEDGSQYSRKIRKDQDYIDALMASNEINFANAMPKDNIRDESLSIAQTMARYQNFSTKTCKNLFLMDVEKINNELIESVLLWIVSGDHDYPRTGSILIFLPGIAEITSLHEQLETHPVFGFKAGKFVLLPLHSSLTSEEQSAIFRKPKNNQRKIVISTNLAETSVTIDDCVFVIDSGKMKEKHFDPNKNMESLETVWVTRANALQRKGRAGRVMPGVCVHLYTSHRFHHHMLPQPVPEIHRIPLEQLILNIKILPNFEDRDASAVLGSFIEPPVLENISTAMKRLQDVGALNKSFDLTALGHHLAALPVDVRVGKLMLYGSIFGCIDSALTIAACLSFKSPFVSPFGKRDEADAKKKKFAVGCSDHITMWNAYKKWLTVYKKSPFAGRNFAGENFLSQKTMVTIADIKHQFLELLVDIGFVPIDLGGRKKPGQDNVLELTGSELNKNGENFRLLSSIICAALYPNIIKVLTPSKSFIMSSAGAVPKEHNPKDLKFLTKQENVFMHPSSVNYTVTSYASLFLVYQEKVKTSKVYFRDCTMVPIIPLVLFAGFDLNISVQNEVTFISLEDGWIVLQVEEHKIAEMMKMMRIELFDLLEEKIKDPLLNLMHHNKGEKVISTILNMINL